MTEHFFDPAVLQQVARTIVDRMSEVAVNHERTYPAAIEAVLVFSGPGTYYDRLKPGQDDRLRWMDRDRIRAGVAIVREVTVSRVVKDLDEQDQVTIPRPSAKSLATKEAIRRQGPLLVYNGIPQENEVFRRAIASQLSKLPKEKTVVIDEVVDDDGTTHPIRHTGDQFKSFFQQLSDPSSPLSSVENIALVAHIPDFVRHPFYAERYSRPFEVATGRKLKFWAYGLKPRPETAAAHTQAELSRLVAYATTGDLATSPVQLQF